ncbi:putative ribonucleoside-diphosphate reductase small chain B, partial [Mucuna pruriens]
MTTPLFFSTVSIPIPEPILTPNPSRRTIFPVQFPQICELYKKAKASFGQRGRWTSLGTSLGTSPNGTLSPMFFPIGDGIIFENLASKLSNSLGECPL